MATLEHEERLSPALAMGESVGISRAQMFPPLFRLLARIGVPVRPLHFLPPVVALIVLAVGLAATAGAFWWVMDATGFENSRKWHWLHGLGAQNMMLIGAALGGVMTLFIRAQALRSDLPRWHEV